MHGHDPAELHPARRAGRGSRLRPAAVGPFVTQALAETGEGDAEILNFALTLEYLEAAFYEEGQAARAQRRGKGTPRCSVCRSQNTSRADGGDQELGGNAGRETTFVFPVTDEKSFLALASTLENTGVGAYNGAAPSLKSKEVLASAGSIVQIEARHAAAIDLLIGKSPTPNQGFDMPLTKEKVLATAGPLIKK